MFSDLITSDEWAAGEQEGRLPNSSCLGDLTRQCLEVEKQSSGWKGTNWDTKDGCRTIKTMLGGEMEEQKDGPNCASS